MSAPSQPAGPTTAQKDLEELIVTSAPDIGATDAAGGSDDEDDDENDEADLAAEGSSTAAVAAAGPADGEGAKKKKKKKKGKGKKVAQALKSVLPGGNQEIPNAVMDKVMEEVAKLPEGADKEQLNEAEVRKGLQAMKLMDFLKSGGDASKFDINGASGSSGSKKDLGEHKFWKTQPVVQAKDALSGTTIPDGPIDPPRSVSDIRSTPYPLPSDFTWSTIDVESSSEIKELYELLTYNYVEDQEATMRFNYSAEFLDWALKPPGYVKDWQVGVRVKSTGKLVAFISGIPVSLRARSNLLNASEINFLVVHKKLRSKRLAPVLIKEVTRRCNIHGVFQAVYTAGVVLPTPVAVSRYYHRTLNAPKLIDIGFAYVPRGQTLARFTKSLAMPAKALTPGWREMEAGDLPQVTDLLGRYLARFDITPEYDTREVEHWLLSGRGTGEKGANRAGKGRRKDQVTFVYVVEDPDSGKITDVMSFYSLPSSILNNAKHSLLNAAYTFYYATEAAFAPADGEIASSSGAGAGDEDSQLVARKEQRLRALMKDLLIEAKAAEFDVMNSLTMLDNPSFLADQKFGPGSGYLNYYLYNWRTAKVSGGFPDDRSGTSGVGLVML